MKTAIDSSAFAKRYVREIDSDRLYQILQNATELALCVVLVPEVTSGLNRRILLLYDFFIEEASVTV